jgi:anti-sigma B factor antagonist
MAVPSDPFSATVVRAGADAVVTLVGELDMATAPSLADVLDSLLSDGPGEIVVDLAGLSFIDSSGLAVLVTTQNALGEQGRGLSLRSPRRHAVKVLEMAGLVNFLDVRTEPDPEPLGSE